ncbi:MAG: M28 family peptidase [Flavobacteriia bacterium]|nr:M28 family peptidase [Flavobacteriia bacterium]OIP46186.1 MAG: peptidase M28 [Flavobacteriaceae bacterium CG2_30_31_66]PIV96974.1 MAG: peptidase M28 [Flavobacteriaceae bacterium CG17_big_fil_post_rev_8_21_14_2_50_31_13]PIX13025.1 MAG: peptidase M28 [Flavobacteriaceae bacterium CG_4_8_14_3_um_filter_31_8]PIY15280.1 MAG: peptidase M28 [Flavobacteriaceae bacterium CG_4_10_14_3_um_filter_31_253]PIZ12031.1 MAG: peptidase M28 [Flavobacteriaceae bacterium CG_4_10_14_0_8_um_filter_31_99]PJC09480.1
MKKFIYVFLVFASFISCDASKKVIQLEPSTINSETTKSNFFIDSLVVKKHLYILASDEMQGRETGTLGIEKAAKYIENEFKRIGLTTFEGLNSYRQTFTFTNRRTNKDITTANIIGVLEGKSKKNEYVIISAHYDHLGFKKTAGKLDSIYNGANDDASGVTAVLVLAEYFKKKNNNERTLVFVAFTGEEMGLIGSTQFGKGIDASKFVAGINLEMIGKTPSFGPNTAWLTGFERSDFGKIIQKNLVGTGYQLFPDPYDKFNLFFRSDNASLARLGVPSHTFSTTPIDVDKDYHQASDEATTLNMTVITQTIQAVAKGTESIIEGKDTPTRVVIEQKN